MTPSQRAQRFIQTIEAQVIPLNREGNLAAWEAATTGSDAAYRRAADLEAELATVFADRSAYRELNCIRTAAAAASPLIRRQLELLHFKFLSNQLPPERIRAMVRLQSRIEQRFATFRVQTSAGEFGDNAVEDVLKTETDSTALEAIWRASKAVGVAVADDVRELVRLRNAAARQMGFPDFHAMWLHVHEQDRRQVDALFDEADTLTRNAFNRAKARLDERLADRYGIPASALMPWHYQNRFFQEPPAADDADHTRHFAGVDPVAVAREFFSAIGLSVETVVAASDLYERAGKNQHAFCMDVDRTGDVRVLANVRSDSRWMGTLLHEFGHAVYDQGVDPELPWLLREPAHIFTTEAVAMLFGRLVWDARWRGAWLGVEAGEVAKCAETCYSALCLGQLVFSRWAQVMYRFERSLYAEPDQDLQQLWWELVAEYQGLKRPAGQGGADWAAKIHIATYPVYYHNYLLGELLASQLQAALESGWTVPTGRPYWENPETGPQLRQRIFRAGRRYPWSELLVRETGEPLSTRHFARQFVDSVR
ncbi:MAG TPA: M2 family metallopeptidase [Acidobacteriota bacterium]|nr:M2 family metallopeptidase [Acidobacteriota bacterium]HQF88627.1 M2 family metallopeptidase [Acidobacteriota bacterium]HQG91525.1 M2 family metallopeptidase [Acidobacteriota bacterium]HQK87846.1 M2 family metallopeptidase [Acidobacteriota bacterium]